MKEVKVEVEEPFNAEEADRLSPELPEGPECLQYPIYVVNVKEELPDDTYSDTCGDEDPLSKCDPLRLEDPLCLEQDAEVKDSPASPFNEVDGNFADKSSDFYWASSTALSNSNGKLKCNVDSYDGVEIKDEIPDDDDDDYEEEVKTVEVKVEILSDEAVRDELIRKTGAACLGSGTEAESPPKMSGNIPVTADSRGVVGKKRFKCGECAKSFAKGSHLKEHLVTHTGIKPFTCQECGKSFSLSRQLKRHAMRFAKMECGKSYFKSHNLQTHTEEKSFKCEGTDDSRGHVGKKIFKCGECDKLFTRSSYLKEHLMTHTGIRPFMCQECGKSFYLSRQLKQHAMRHGDKKLFACKECDKYYTDLGQFENHLRMHARTMSFKSSDCDDALPRPTHPSEYKRMHDGEKEHTGQDPEEPPESPVKRFACPECGKLFRHLGNVKQHMTTHRGERPFGCPECGKTYALLGRLTQHLKDHQKSREKPFGCSECGASFSHSGNLKQHMVKHTGEKRFKCGECGEAFRYVISLKQHIKKHSKVI